MVEIGVSSRVAKDRLFEQMSCALLPQESEQRPEYRQYLSNLAHMHFEGGSKVSGSIVGIKMLQEHPLDCISEFLSRYCDQAVSFGDGDKLGRRLSARGGCSDRDYHDDRQAILHHGGSAQALAEPETGISYHLLKVPGTVNVATVAEALAEHKESAMVKLLKTPKGQYSLNLVDTNNSPGSFTGISTEWATMIIGPDKTPGADHDESTKLKIYTIHAGLPMAPLPLGTHSSGEFVYFDVSQVSKGLDEYVRDLIGDQASSLPLNNAASQDLSASDCVTLTLRQAGCLFGRDVAVRFGADVPR